MAVKLRLKRMGKKKKPFYRIVAADSRASRNGRFIESVGTYDPIASPHKVDYNEDRILHWLSVGAQPTTTVKSLFSGKGLWLKWTLIKQGADEAKIAAEVASWEKIQEEKLKQAEAKASAKAKEKSKKKAEEAKNADQQAAQQSAVPAAAAVPVAEEVAATPETVVEAAETSEVAETAVEVVEEVPVAEASPVAEETAEVVEEVPVEDKAAPEADETEKKSEA